MRVLPFTVCQIYVMRSRLHRRKPDPSPTSWTRHYVFPFLIPRNLLHSLRRNHRFSAEYMIKYVPYIPHSLCYQICTHTVLSYAQQKCAKSSVIFNALTVSTIMHMIHTLKQKRRSIMFWAHQLWQSWRNTHRMPLMFFRLLFIESTAYLSPAH